MNNILFTTEECEWLKTFYIEEKAIDGSNPIKLEKSDGSTFTITLRQGRIGNKGFFYHSNDSELINFLLNKLKHLNIKNIDEVKFIKYQTGDVLAPHVDFSKYGVTPNYKTIVVQLSDGNDYTGGDFCINGIPQSRTQGSYNMFYRTVEHGVNKVTSGTRFSMTLFLSENDIEINKSII